jgi:hypothetical protein
MQKLVKKLITQFKKERYYGEPFLAFHLGTLQKFLKTRLAGRYPYKGIPTANGDYLTFVKCVDAWIASKVTRYAGKPGKGYLTPDVPTLDGFHLLAQKTDLAAQLKTVNKDGLTDVVQLADTLWSLREQEGIFRSRGTIWFCPGRRACNCWTYKLFYQFVRVNLRQTLVE